MRQSAKKKRRNRAKQNMGVILITLVVLAMLAVLGIHTANLKAQDAVYEAKVRDLEAQVAAEEQKAEELEEKSIYVQTRDYIEQIARERLGLVNPDDAIVKANP